MPDTKITALTAITTVDPAVDVLPIVDVSDTTMAASGTTKKITSNQILGAGGTATLASATITGDLTVDTSTLKVDSTNNRVGIGTASPGAIFDIYQATLGTAYFRGGYAARQMSITATSDGSNDGAIHTFSIGSSAGQFAFANSSGTRMTLDSSGNVGIGVTPSAKLDVQTSAGRFKVENFGASSVKLSSSGSFGFTATEHQFLLGATQSMTLDASGYLLIGTTDTAFTSGAGYKFGPGATPSSGQVGASSSNGDLTYRLYSTGAAAYRFYVGFGGTVFATNTTISAISDARLKENVQDIDVGLGAILALKPRKFDWKAGKGKDIKGDRGFIAQEFEQVFPQLVDEWADPAPEGETPYKSVRQDLIPVLVKAIQELAAEVNALKNA